VARTALSILFVTAELSPLATTGGLGDIAAGLPTALAALGHRVSIFLPLYRSVRDRGLALSPVVDIPVPGIGGGARIFHAPGGLGPADLYLVEHHAFFDRGGIYGDASGEFGDNLERFSFFSRAVPEAVVALGFDVDIIHSNDWHTGLVPAYLRTLYAHRQPLAGAAKIFTIHNVAYQGRFSVNRLPTTGLPWSAFHIEGLEFYGGINLLKAGIVYADAVTTVSPRYAAEICTPELGEGLDGVLRARRSVLQGITNGIDDARWDPKTDPNLAARYDRTDLSGKRRCKEELLGEMGLSASLESPLLAMISRLTWQKGCDIVLGVAEDILRLRSPAGREPVLVLLGSGDRWLEQGYRDLAARHPGRVAVRIGFDEPLAHRIEAGADAFLMPSRYEPCGLNQMYSLRYGTVPIVRATGGLDDTVRDIDLDGERGNGFKFPEPRGDQMVAAIARALALHDDRSAWERLSRRGMAEDFSWHRSAMRYAELYQGVLRR
jgi:starch synthase